MELMVMYKPLRTSAVLIAILAPVTLATAQTPTSTQTPAPVSQPTSLVPVDPSAATPGAATPPGAAVSSDLVDPAAQSLEPIRQAIARQDYPAAQAALDRARQAIPDHPGIPLYESLIKRGQEQGPVLNAQPGNSTPASTTLATPASAQDNIPAAPPPLTNAEAPAPSGDGLTDKAKDLWENEMIRYGVLGVLALVILAIIFSIMKKRRDSPDTSPYESDEATPVSTGAMTMGGMDDHLDEGQQPTDFASYNSSQDFSSGEPSTPEYTSGSSGSGDDMGGSALSGGMAGYNVATFDHDDEDEEATPPPRPAPVKPVDDDAMINIFADDEPAPATPVKPAPAAPVVPSTSESFESLGFDANPPSQPALAPYSDEETVILSAPDAEPLRPAASSNTTPSSTPSLSSGTVDLEDIFGAQPLPGETDSPSLSKADSVLSPASSNAEFAAPSDAALGSASLSEPEAEDPNSLTLPTFVSSPGAENPEDNDVAPPQTNQRPKPEEGSDTQSISFEELFGSPDESSVSEPESGQLAEPPLPAASAPATPPSEDSVEDALAAALSAMAAESPDAAPAPAAASDEVPVQSSESLDDRTERMFSDQMDKARRAVSEKNWRQAVHVLSIASALHPENEEAKQMLKDSRAEKRKSEESV